MSEVKVDTISERTAAGGVTIDGVLVKDGVATFQTAAGSPLVFEGATADAFETTFAITDPTADRTITFPDASFTVPSTGGKVLQVVQTVKTDTTTTTATGSSWADISGLSVTITPAATTSKILVSYTVVVGAASGYWGYNLLLVRDSTGIFLGDAASSRVRASASDAATITNQPAVTSGQFLDSPSTTSATVYKMQWTGEGGSSTWYLNRSSVDGDIVGAARNASSITVMEIGA
jgi:hypothetical protein